MGSDVFGFQSRSASKIARSLARRFKSAGPAPMRITSGDGQPKFKSTAHQVLEARVRRRRERLDLLQRLEELALVRHHELQAGGHVRVARRR